MGEIVAKTELVGKNCLLIKRRGNYVFDFIHRNKESVTMVTDFSCSYGYHGITKNKQINIPSNNLFGLDDTERSVCYGSE